MRIQYADSFDQVRTVILGDRTIICPGRPSCILFLHSLPEARDDLANPVGPYSFSVRSNLDVYRRYAILQIPGLVIRACSPRVLHNRPNPSTSSLERLENADCSSSRKSEKAT